MNTFRNGIIPRLLAALVVAGTILSVSLPALGARSEHPHAFENWLRMRLGDAAESGVDAAVEAAVAAAAGTSGNFHRAVATALVKEAPELAARMVGMVGASEDALVLALESLFGSALRDALLPRAFLIASKSLVSPSIDRSGSGAAREAAHLMPAFERGTGIVPERTSLHVSPLQFLSVVQPQGP